MADFLSGLAKGFIRSAVNQVGRDAGKVVSNQVYGDAHSTPYRSVSGNNSDGRIVGVGKIEDEGLKVIEPSVGKAIAWAFVGILFNVIGCIVLIISGYRRLKDKYRVSAWKYESQAVWVADRRYKTGERYDGHQLTRHKVKVDASEYEIEQNEKIAKIYLYTGFFALILFIVVTATAKYKWI